MLFHQRKLITRQSINCGSSSLTTKLIEKKNGKNMRLHDLLVVLFSETDKYNTNVFIKEFLMNCNSKYVKLSVL